jgi:hypothetical protein
MKVEIPEQLKADVPPSVWGKMLAATPVVMAVVATMLAGLSSSEMTRAQYDRSLAAQQQSKAGDQWSFFQAKRLRGAFQRHTLDLLQSMTELDPIDSAALPTAIDQLCAQAPATRQAEATQIKVELLALLNSAAGKQMFVSLQSGDLPSAGKSPELPPNVKAAEDAVETLKPDAEMAVLLAPIDNLALEAMVRASWEHSQALDAATKPINDTLDRLEALVLRLAACAQPPASTNSSAAGLRNGATLSRDITAIRLRYTAIRYEAEARINQGIASLYELQVRKSNISADRHHRRSQRFFFGMLGAQLGVIISTFAMAARKRNLLWGLAAGAGIVAIVFAIYVYLYV